MPSNFQFFNFNFFQKYNKKMVATALERGLGGFFPKKIRILVSFFVFEIFWFKIFLPLT